MGFNIIHDISCGAIRCVYQLLDIFIHPSADLIYSLAVLRRQYFSFNWDYRCRTHRCKWSNKRGNLIINTVLVFMTQRERRLKTIFLYKLPQKTKFWIFHLQGGEVKTRGDLFSTEILKGSSLSKIFRISALF